MTSYPDELAHYEAKNDTLRRGQLKAVQAAAGKWSALMAGFLGVFGTVTFAGGLNTVDNLPSPYAPIVKGTTTLAAVAAVLALWFLARAAGGLRITDLQFPNGKQLMEREIGLVDDARKNVGRGRFFALTTAGLVLAGSVLVLWAPSAPSDPKFLVRFDNAAMCGPLTGKDDKLSIGDRSLVDATEVIPVTDCPAG
ncbi:hypothetical protein [Paractinoplanes lichenicola]|uniref:Uncharacterized protein n=1 Tax=Paractinoplanes lichenicola TaxID=2802976 RepID=A0ABS1VXL2_9ACTN|nr:hypothetical protein [Actinoplanes lichenicola]MBL7259236.1 hypothetical protein [Actinoplanes lichenicola]